MFYSKYIAIIYQFKRIGLSNVLIYQTLFVFFSININLIFWKYICQAVAIVNSISLSFLCLANCILFKESIYY